MKLLHIDSSVTGPASVSRQLTRAVVEQWRRAHPAVDVIYRDLAEAAPAHLSAERLGAAAVPAERRSAEQRAEAVHAEQLLAEFLAADVVVLGAPMYNFTIPSQLKAWLDRVLVAGRTFKYTEHGPVGLAGGKKLVIVSTRGGVYAAGSPAQAMDHQEAYLKTAFGFIGIDDVTVVRAEGVSVQALRDEALAAAERQVRGLLDLSAAA